MRLPVLGPRDRRITTVAVAAFSVLAVAASAGAATASGADLIGAAVSVPPPVPAAQRDTPRRPVPPPNPALGPAGTATPHGDAESSDSTPAAGTGIGPVAARFTSLAESCPAILAGSDGLPQALCTRVVDRSPVLHLLDPATGLPLTSLTLKKGGVLSGVSAYVDHQDRVVLVDGEEQLLRIGHHRDPSGAWQLTVDDSTPVAAAVSRHCGTPGCDAVTAVLPDYAGRVWLATRNGSIGVVDTVAKTLHSVLLPNGEHIDNPISTAPEGTAVASTRGLYLLTADALGVPRIRWRVSYDPGPARKPGQLSWGTGSSPTFFGPHDGADYVTITDNAVPREHVLIYNARSAELLCSVPVLAKGASGTGNAAIGVGSSVFVTGTYGYPYPALPADAGPSDPPSAPFTGGMARVDVDPDGSSCAETWENSVRSAAAPRLSRADGKIYTVTRAPQIGADDATGRTDRYADTVIDAGSGSVLSTHQIGAGFTSDPLEMAGIVTPDGVRYQGTMTGVYRIESDKR